MSAQTPTTGGMPPTGAAATGELNRRSMSPLEVLAQSVAGIAPSAVLATGPLLVAASAGQGTWLSYVFASLIVLVVGYNIVQFSKRSASVGSLYSYVGQGLGAPAAFTTGAGLLIGYTCISMVCVLGAGIYTAAVLDKVGVDATGTAGQIVLYTLFTAIAVWFTVRGVRTSTQVGLALEVLSIGAILVLLVVVLGQAAGDGTLVDPAQLRLDGATWDGVTFGIVLAVLGFVGFEGAASLGAEARDPYRAIPRAVLLSAAGAGLLYVLGAYTTLISFDGPEGLLASAAPLNDMAVRAGMGWFSSVIDLGATASFVACIIGSSNAAARVLFAMGREGLLHPALGRAHRSHATPHRALYLLLPVVLVVPAVLLATGSDPATALGYVGTIGTFGYMTAYALVSIAMPIWLRRLGLLRPLQVVTAVVATAAVLYVFYKNVVPAAPSPLDRLPWIFLALLGAALVWYAVLRVTRPERAAAAGLLVEEDHPLAESSEEVAPYDAPPERPASAERTPL